MEGTYTGGQTGAWTPVATFEMPSDYDPVANYGNASDPQFIKLTVSYPDITASPATGACVMGTELVQSTGTKVHHGNTIVQYNSTYTPTVFLPAVDEYTQNTQGYLTPWDWRWMVPDQSMTVSSSGSVNAGASTLSSFTINWSVDMDYYPTA